MKARENGWHWIGVAGLFAAGVGWFEWFAVPVMYPDRAGPLPYGDFAILEIVLSLSCLIFVGLDLVLPLIWRWRLLYACGPLSYVAGTWLARLI